MEVFTCFASLTRPTGIASAVEGSLRRDLAGAVTATNTSAHQPSRVSINNARTTVCHCKVKSFLTLEE